MNQRETLERSLGYILDSMGVRAVRQGGNAVHIDEEADAYRIRIALPVRYVDVKLEHMAMVTRREMPDYVMRMLDAGRVALFDDTIAHVAAHYHSPLDRMRDLENAAKALLDVLRVNLEDIRMPHGASSKVEAAAYALRDLLQAKPRAVSWRRDGYGADPPEVVALAL